MEVGQGHIGGCSATGKKNTVFGLVIGFIEHLRKGKAIPVTGHGGP
jgi:hypothetical protein